MLLSETSTAISGAAAAKAAGPDHHTIDPNHNNNQKQAAPPVRKLEVIGGLLLVLYVLFALVVFCTFTDPMLEEFEYQDGTASLSSTEEEALPRQDTSWQTNRKKAKSSSILSGSVVDIAVKTPARMGRDPLTERLHIDKKLATKRRQEVLDLAAQKRAAQEREDYEEFPNRPVLTAYLEDIHQEEWKIKPLPVRDSTAQASKLKSVRYPRLRSCSKLPEQFPVDDPPTMTDPFLPWIHDVFPSADGKFIQFVAQNRRRCQSGMMMGEIKAFMQPQASLFQHVPVKRVTLDKETRYQLCSHKDADEDGLETRFICRFKPSMEETLAVHNFNYDYHSWRKGYSYTFTEEGFDNHMIWSSQLLFKCPVPHELQQIIRSGSSVVDDYATLFVDVIPIRTPPRYTLPAAFLIPKHGKPPHFLAEEEWGRAHILPRLDDSGRWENIPICKPSLQTYPPETMPNDNDTASTTPGHSLGVVGDNRNSPTTRTTTILKRTLEGDASSSTTDPKKKRLIACTWASTSFHTRGERTKINDGASRMREWIEFHLLVGFDHVYVYDNSGQFSLTESLQEVTDLFPGQVTRVNWPSEVCNNRPGTGDNKGERSSQYAAESSCRLRFGAHADWMASFDTDEYLVPMGRYRSFHDILDQLDEEGTKILSFKSYRTRPRWALFDRQPVDDVTCSGCFNPIIPPDRTFLQVYNCEQERPPKKKTVPAEKQIYRADYVLLHFIHYATVTTVSTMSKAETLAAGLHWKQRYREEFVRYSDELREASMIHTKSIVTTETNNWLTGCKLSAPSCKVGTPFGPEVAEKPSVPVRDKDGFTANCFINEWIENFWIPLLEARLQARGSIPSLAGGAAGA